MLRWVQACQARDDVDCAFELNRQHRPQLRARCVLRATLIERLKAMQVPLIFLGESRTRLLQGIAIGAVASMVIGFSWAGGLPAQPPTNLRLTKLGPLL